jgi:sarcosine oxidase subunit alpha
MKAAQIAVDGGGPAGLSAALAAAKTGAQTVLLDEQPVVGGQLRYRVTELAAGPYGTIRPMALANRLVAEAVDAGVEILADSVVWGFFADNVLTVITGEASYQMQAERIIFATGSTDLPFPFAGGSLPGVFTARAMQLLINRHRVLPARRFVVIGAGPEADELAADIALAGGEVVARVDQPDSAKIVASGPQGIEAVTIDSQAFDAEIVVIAVGRLPDPELALMAECAVGFSDALRGWTPVRNERLQTSQSAIWVAGDVAGICDVETALVEGTYAGVAAAASLGFENDDALEQARAVYESLATDRIRQAASMGPTYAQVVHDPIGV